MFSILWNLSQFRISNSLNISTEAITGCLIHSQVICVWSFESLLCSSTQQQANLCNNFLCCRLWKNERIRVKRKTPVVQNCILFCIDFWFNFTNEHINILTYEYYYEYIWVNIDQLNRLLLPAKYSPFGVIIAVGLRRKFRLHVLTPPKTRLMGILK